MFRIGIYLNTSSSLYKIVFKIVRRLKFFIGLWKLVDELGSLEFRKDLVVSRNLMLAVGA